MNNSSTYRKLAIAFGIFIFVLAAVWIGAHYFIESKIKDRIGKVDFLTIDKVKVPWTLDRIELNGLKAKEDSASQRFSGSACETIIASGIGWWDLISNQKLIIDSLSLHKGNFSFNAGASKAKISKDSSGGKLEEIVIRTIALTDFTVNATLPKQQKFSVGNVLVRVDSLAYQMVKPGEIAYRIREAELIDGTFKKEGIAYDFSWDSLRMNDQQTLTLHQFLLQPKYKKENWSNQFKYKKARLALEVPLLRLQNFSFDSLVQNQKLLVDSLQVDDAKLSVYTDQDMPPCPNCDKIFPHQRLFEAKFPVALEKIIVNNASIDIEVESKKTGRVGEIAFEKIAASIYNVQNLSSGKIKADIQSSFMGASPLQVEVEFDMTPEEFPYTLRADLKNFDLSELNTFLYLTKRTRIESGYCDAIYINYRGTQRVARGDFRMNYRDLKLKLYEKNEKDEKGIISGLINGLAINQNNQPGGEDYREGKIYYEHPNNRSMFHQWWQATKSGFKSVVMPKMMLSDELK